MSNNSWVTPLISGGIGAALASIAGALIQAVSKKGESRATAADLITRAGVAVIAELRKSNEQQAGDVERVRDALCQLTDCVEDVMEHVPDELRPHLRACLHTAHKVL